MTTFAPTIDTALASVAESLAAGEVEAAAEMMEPAVRATPTDLDGLRTLAMIRLEQARTLEAVQLLELIARRTNRPDAWSEWLFYGLHTGAATPAHHAAYAAKSPRGPLIPAAYDGSRPLRIGYLCGHLRDHTVTRFLLPVLEGHSDAVEVFAYHDGPTDAVTARVRGLCRHWREAGGLTDHGLYHQIRRDSLDVLIDLDGHLNAGRRQRVTMARPSPIVAGFIGYPVDTSPGVHRITDSIIDPTDAPNLIRLPGCCYAFEPRPAPIAPAPAARNGFVTFGSLNRPCKISPATAATWGRIMAETPDARLIVLARGGENNRSVRQMLQGAGVDGDRLTLHPGGDAAAFTALIDSVDVALDPWPYGGMTTTADCLYQGVPVVTRDGGTPAGRVTASMLTAIGLPDLIAGSEEEYVRIAVEAASSPFLSMREERRRLVAPLLDGRRVARELERALVGYFSSVKS